MRHNSIALTSRAAADPVEFGSNPEQCKSHHQTRMQDCTQSSWHQRPPSACLEARLVQLLCAASLWFSSSVGNCCLSTKTLCCTVSLPLLTTHSHTGMERLYIKANISLIIVTLRQDHKIFIIISLSHQYSVSHKLNF